MEQAKQGDTVQVHYTGKLTDGTVFDSSDGRDPLRFKLGTNEVISGFEKGVKGMSPGDEKTITIPAEEAYGERDDSLVFEVQKSMIPSDLDPQVGQYLQMKRGDQKFDVVVQEVNDDSISLDANHPLAGQDLVFDVQLLNIV